MQPHTFLFFGRSGSGKGTQAQLLIKHLAEIDPSRKSLYIETGRLFREFTQSHNLTSKLTNEVLHDGGLLPPFLPVWLWTNELVNKFSGDEHLVLDGLARRAAEAPVLDSALEFYKRDLVHVVIIETGRKWSIDRLKERGRGDDLTENDIDSKMSWYESNVVPAIEYLEGRRKFELIRIDGERPIEEVHKDIINSLSLNE